MTTRAFANLGSADNVVIDSVTLNSTETSGALPAAKIGAHAVNHNNGGTDEISVAGLNGVLADPQPPIIGAGATEAVAGNDARLTNARTPTAHAASHANGGTDEISVAGLSGVLADPQPPIIGIGAGDAVAGNDGRLTNARTPTAHAASHQNGGTDEINVGGLSGVLADPQPPIIGAGVGDAVAGNDARLTNARTPTAHTHDAVADLTGAARGDILTGSAVAGSWVRRPVSGSYGHVPSVNLAGTDWAWGDVPSHGPNHEQGSVDQMSLINMPINTIETTDPATLVVGAVADGQYLKRVGLTIVGGAPSSGAHAASHQNGGVDEIDVQGLSGVLAASQIANKLEVVPSEVLTIAGVADGQYLRRVGTTVVGASIAGGGSADIKTALLQFGNIAVAEKWCVVAEPAVISGQLIIASQSYEEFVPGGSFKPDENEFFMMHLIVGKIVPGVSFSVFARSVNGHRELQGSIPFNYIMG